MTSVKDKNVLITGAASGIGRLMAILLAKKGAKVILCDVNQDGLEKLKCELQEQGLHSVVFCCNLSNRQDIKHMSHEILQHHGTVHILINNAGIVFGKTLLELEDSEIISTFAVNTLPLFWLSGAFLPAMLSHGQGHIVTISSAGGLVGVPQLVDYCASKFAAFGFDDALRLEMKHSNKAINTTVVCPFYINTGMFSGVKTRFANLLPILEPEQVAARIVKAIENNQTRVILPRFVTVVWLARLLPVSWFDALTNFFGISKSMDSYVGRKH